ncbi:MAG: aminomethyl-transferring glycine dehydrogenase subunit GcvPB [Verrucomicrobiales bacterium]|nr:aminomethyl-transferring glycine dehydrogenase subunit GcvPB [Verrucomicrobiales bacterium]
MKQSILDKPHSGRGQNSVFDREFCVDGIEFELPGLREDPLGLPDLTEVEVVRHFTELTRESYGVDNGSYPLGSCTMKYNPKRNDKLAALPGFQRVHPGQPAETMRGIWRVMYELQLMLNEILGMDAFSLQPAAGANGELAGLFIKKYFDVKKEKDRKVILVADSAHGTNPASATMAGFDCRIISTNESGTMDLEDLRSNLRPDVAALMLTNPSTLGLFETNITEIAGLIHANGSLLYYDGANLNALMGIVRPGDMGFDVVHINTHKTLSTPHSGGGPGAGPVGVKKFLQAYLPGPVADYDGEDYFPSVDKEFSIGRMKSGFGHFDVLVKAYCYILTNGPDGLKECSENAVLNANYLQAGLRDIIPPVFDRLCMHECLLNGDLLRISAYSFAKRLIDYKVHPPTLVGAGCVYFSDDLGSAILIEPTETETKADLDRIVSVFKMVWDEVLHDAEFVNNAPYSREISKVPMASKEVI